MAEPRGPDLATRSVDAWGQRSGPWPVKSGTPGPHVPGLPAVSCWQRRSHRNAEVTSSRKQTRRTTPQADFLDQPVSEPGARRPRGRPDCKAGAAILTPRLPGQAGAAPPPTRDRGLGFPPKSPRAPHKRHGGCPRPSPLDGKGPSGWGSPADPQRGRGRPVHFRELDHESRLHPRGPGAPQGHATPAAPALGSVCCPQDAGSRPPALPGQRPLLLAAATLRKGLRTHERGHTAHRWRRVEDAAATPPAPSLADGPLGRFLRKRSLAGRPHRHPGPLVAPAAAGGWGPRAPGQPRGANPSRATRGLGPGRTSWDPAFAPFASFSKNATARSLSDLGEDTPASLPRP